MIFSTSKCFLIQSSDNSQMFTLGKNSFNNLTAEILRMRPLETKILIQKQEHKQITSLKFCTRSDQKFLCLDIITLSSLNTGMPHAFRFFPSPGVSKLEPTDLACFVNKALRNTACPFPYILSAAAFTPQQQK